MVYIRLSPRPDANAEKAYTLEVSDGNKNILYHGKTDSLYLSGLLDLKGINVWSVMYLYIWPLLIVLVFIAGRHKAGRQTALRDHEESDIGMAISIC